MNKKELTKNILKNITSKIDKNNNYNLQNKENGSNVSSEVINYDIDLSTFLIVPLNHPEINKIKKILDNYENKTKKVEKITDDKKQIITLKDILNSKEETIIVEKNSIITSLALDYINKNDIELIYIDNKEK